LLKLFEQIMQPLGQRCSRMEGCAIRHLDLSLAQFETQHVAQTRQAEYPAVSNHSNCRQPVGGMVQKIIFTYLHQSGCLAGQARLNHHCSNTKHVCIALISGCQGQASRRRCATHEHVVFGFSCGHNIPLLFMVNHIAFCPSNVAQTCGRIRTITSMLSAIMPAGSVGKPATCKASAGMSVNSPLTRL